MIEGAWEREVRLSGYLILAGIVALAAVLRFALLAQNSVWFDEAYVVYVTRHGWTEIFSVLRSDDAHPPLYYLAMKAWTHFAGTGEVALRFPSACLSTLSVPLTYLLARRVASERTSLLAAFLVGVSPIQIMAGQEARMYPLLGALTLASTLILAAWAERGGGRLWAAYSGVAVLMAYTHYLSVLVLAAHGLWIACCERRRLAWWLAAMAVTLILYAPWAPSLWFQVSQGHGWAWYRPPVAVKDLADLLGLYAFGGSLLGMGSYFGSSLLPTIEQVIIVLPFLVVVGWGVAALARDRRALGLVGLPLALPLGVMYLASLFKPLFYPRWFSFLSPLYAIFLAQGIAALAERFAGRRGRVVAFIVACLLFYSVPVMGSYYFDPTFRPYHWRAAASFVRRQVRPGDFFLYNGRPAEITFSYYFTGGYPSLVLTPVEAVRGGHRSPTFTREQAAGLAADHPRLWVVATLAFSPEMQARLQSELESAFRLVEARYFDKVWVTLLEVKPK